jgi:hypothetical protein
MRVPSWLRLAKIYGCDDPVVPATRRWPQPAIAWPVMSTAVNKLVSAGAPNDANGPSPHCWPTVRFYIR